MLTGTVSRTREELAAMRFHCGSCGRKWRGDELIVHDLDPFRSGGKRPRVDDPKFAHLKELTVNSCSPNTEESRTHAAGAWIGWARGTAGADGTPFPNCRYRDSEDDGPAIGSGRRGVLGVPGDQVSSCSNSVPMGDSRPSENTRTNPEVFRKKAALMLDSFRKCLGSFCHRGGLLTRFGAVNARFRPVFDPLRGGFH